MELEDTPLWKEVVKILDEGPTDSNYGWEAYIHTPKETLQPISLRSVNILRSYHDSFADEITISTLFGLGTFAHKIFPYRDVLEITLRKVPLIENLDEIDPSKEIEAERFTAHLIGKFMSPTIGQGNEADDGKALDISQLIDVHFQLQDKAAEQLRIMLIGGVGRKSNMQNFLTTIITKETEKILVDGERAILGVDMVKADNKDVKEQIVVAQGTRLIDLSDYLQKRIGVYNAGLGSYIQSRYWYVFPLYDTTDFNRRHETLTMLVVPEKKLIDVERTFRTEAGVTTIMVTSKTAFTDDSGTNYQNYGNGARFANADMIMDSNMDTHGNKTLLTRKKNNSEFITERQDDYQYAPVTSNRATANPFAILTQQAAKRGGLFKAVWQNSDMSLIFPGMVVRIIYTVKDEIREIYGIMHASMTVGHKPGGITSIVYKNQTVLEVFVNDQIRPLEA